MTKKVINTAIEEILVSNSPFEYAHLVKFERPFAEDSETSQFRTNANRYAYYTDGPRDISFDDGSVDHDGNSNGSQVYRANRILSLGNYSETTAPRATNMSLTLSGEHLGTSIVLQGTFTNATFTATTELYKGEPLDFVELGFREGDKIKFTKSSGNFSTSVSTLTYIITGFTTDNSVITLATTGNDADDTTTYPTDANTQVTLSLESGELSAITDEKIVSDLSNPSFLHREVFVHKVFIDPDTGDLAGNSSILIFRGIIATCNLSEGETASRVKWGLSSHWADFNQINGRITTDEIHRALDGRSQPQPSVAIRPEYASDLGFMHAETTLNQIASYQTTESRMVVKTKKRGGLAGLLGGTKTYSVEEQYQVDNEVDLSVNLQGKHLPIVYGVQRVQGIPIFADTASTNSKEVYVTYAIAEGEVQGLYNLYIDGVPLICADKADFDVRNASNGTDKDNSQLQCYGRADRGDTLGGSASQNSNSLTEVRAAISELERKIRVMEKETNGDPEDERLLEMEGELWSLEEIYKTLILGAGSVVGDTNAKGMYHEQIGSINHPYQMEFHFFSGKPNQRASNLLTTKAAANGFKRQADYYEGTLPYWSPNHRLLDTAYVVTALTINEDQTTVPELEYVVKGKLIECYNYDNTYEPNPSEGTDAHTNFLEGDTVTVERSTDGSSYSSATVLGSSSTSFKILDKYLWTGTDGEQYYRFRLDSKPDLGYSDGAPSYNYLRLKKTGTTNYWHMRTYNVKIINNKVLNLQKYNPTSVTDSSGTLQMTFSSSDATALQAGYVEYNSNKIYQVFLNSATHLEGLKRSTLTGTWSGNTVTFTGLTGYANIASTGSNLTSLELFKAEPFTLTDSTVVALSNSTDLVGETITLNETGEERIITSFNTTTNTITVNSAFFTLTESAFDEGLTYTITSTKGDKRASNNPAMQLLDYMSSKKYGKDLNISTDASLGSFITSARLCDTRSDVDFTLTTNATVTTGDVYRLTSDGTTNGTHIASGKILSSSLVNSKTKVILTDVSGKFLRKYFNYINYKIGDIVYTTEGNFYRVASAGYKAAKPAHTTLNQTLAGLTYLGTTITLYKESGSGPASIVLDGEIELGYSLYDADFIKYWRYLGWEHHDQMWVTRHQTNFIIDTTKSVFANVNAFLSHFNGLLSYANGKYTLDVETESSIPQISNTFNSKTYDENVNPEYIDNTDIIGSITLNDNSAQKSKNTIKASIFDPQNNWSSRSVSFFNSDFVQADRGTVKTGTFTYSGVTNYYNARIGVEKELIQSRFSKEISFTVGQKGLLLKAGQVISVTYNPFRFDKKLFRIENATFNSNCTVNIKAREYDQSIYTISKQRASRIRQEASTQAAPLAAPTTPTNLSATSDKPGVVILSWTNGTTFNEPTDSTQIWVSDDNNRANAAKVATLDDTVSFRYAIAAAGSKYFWIRHVRRSTSTADNSVKQLLSAYHPTSATGGVNGEAKILSPQLDVDVSSIQIKFNDSGALTPSGTAQDVQLTATLRNITPTAAGVIFTLVDTNQGTQSDVQFTNGSTTVTDTSSLYVATVDASSASSSTTNKFVKVTTTDVSGEVFTDLIPLSITKDGSSGSIGVSAASVKIEPSTHVITYGANDPDAEDPETTITFTTDLQGNTGDSSSAFSGTPYYEFLVDGSTSGSIGTTSTFTLPDASEPEDGDTVEVKVKVRDGATNGTIKATDSVTIFGLKSGSDSTTAFLTNSAHVVSTASNGTGASFTGAGGTFKVLVGTTDKTANCTYAVQSETGVDVSINSGTGVYTVASMSADIGTAIFRATIPASISPTGSAFTIDQTYTIAKSKAGVTPPTPADGAPGLRTIQGYLYYEKTTSGVPGAPSGNTYTFSSGLISGSGINDSGTTNVWRNAPRTQNATSSNTFYTVRYYGTEASAGSNTIAVVYSTVTVHINFDGVVTFTNSNTQLTDGGTPVDIFDGDFGSLANRPLDLGDFTNDDGFVIPTGVAAAVNNNTTTINGAKITTGTVNADVLSANTTLTNRLYVGSILEVNTSGKIYSTGKTDYADADAGFFLGYSSGAYKFDIGSSSKHLRWDGSNLTVKGDITGSTGTFGGVTLSSTGLAITGTGSSINLGSGNFIATGAGAVTANDITLSGSINAGLSSGSGATLVQISTGTTIFRAGADADAPIEVVKTGTDSVVKLNNVEIYNASGSQVFSSASGFSDEFFSGIAQTTGTAVSTISKTVTNSSATTDAQKVVLTANQTLTISVSKPGEMSGYAFGTNAQSSEALNKIPAKVQMRLMVSTNSNLSGATEIANLGTSFTNGVTRTTGTASATQYKVIEEEELEPGFRFFEAHVFQANNTSLLSGGKFVISNTASYSGTSSGTTYYFFAEIGGTAGTQNSGINSVSNTAASRTISVTAASGESFFIDESGDGSEASSGDITAVIAGNGLTGGATTGSATLTVGSGTGITVNANDIALSNTSVSAGSYTNTNLTVDAQGRITSASNGSSGSGATNLSTTTATTQITINSSTGTNAVIGEATGSIAGLMSTTHHNKLDGIATGATNTAAPYYTSAIAVGDGGLTQNNFTNADHTKLNGIATGANNYSFPYTVSASASNGTVVQRHASGYIFANYFNTTPNTVTSGITQICVETGNDGYIRHGTAAAVRSFINVANGATNTAAPYYTSAIAVGDGGLTQKNFTTTLKTKLDGIAANANNYAFPYTVSASASNNTIVQRHSSGYIFSNYINTTDNVVSSGVVGVMIKQSDDYHRTANSTAIKSFLGVGDGSLTQKNFTTTLKNKLDGISAGATTNTGTVTSVSGGTGLNGTVTGSGSLNLDSDLSQKVNKIGGTTSNLNYLNMTNPQAYSFVFNNVTEFLFGFSGDFHADGDIVAYSTSVSSDIKLKENIQDLEGSLDKITQLKGIKFDWKEEKRPNNQLGFIAQEVEKVIPELVTETDSLGEREGENHKVVNYQGVIPVLVEAIKELKAEIEELKNANRK